MKNETIEIVKLINENKTLNEISAATGLSNRQLFTKLSMLRSSGFLFDRKHYYNGDISYCIFNPIVQTTNSSNEVTLEIPNNQKKIHILLTSDTHLGHKYDNLTYIDKMMNYCIKKNVHTIINAGDFFAGICPNNKNIVLSNALEQIQYGLQNYPYDKSILTFVCLGNHDATFWLENGMDIKTVLLDRRHDIIPLGYAYGILNIADNKIVVQHPIELINTDPNPNINEGLVIRGHSHRFKKGLMIYVPTMSKVITRANQNPIPSMIDIELTLTEQGIQHEILEQFVFIDNEFIKVGETEYNVPIPTKRKEITKALDERKPRLSQFYSEKENVIQEEQQEDLRQNINEVNPSPETPKIMARPTTECILQDKYQGMSQIEKFNARYGKVLKK